MQKTSTTTRILISVAAMLGLTGAGEAATPAGDADAAPPLWGVPVLNAPWDAKTELVDDYATARYGQPWDFSHGQGQAHFGPGLRSPRIEGGKLLFTTGENENTLYWGNHYLEPKWSHDEKIGYNWPMWVPVWEVTVRLKQSLPTAKWRVIARMVDNNGDRPLGRLTATENNPSVWTKEVQGTDWQEVDFNPRWQRIDITRISLAVECLTPNNTVEIEWVQARQRVEYSYWRGGFQVPDEVFDARCYIIAQPGYELYVNGRKVAADYDNALGWRPWEIDLSQDVVKGRNTIAVKGQMLDWMGRQNFLVLLGVARTLRGKAVEFMASAKDWKVSPQAGPGWELPAYDDSGWSAPRDGGDVTQAGEKRTFIQGAGPCAFYDGRLEGGEKKYSGVYNTRPYTGLLSVRNALDRRRPLIFKLDDGCRVEASVPGAAAGMTVTYTATNAETGAVAFQGMATPERDGAISRFAISGKVRAPGVYDLTVEMKGPGIANDVWKGESVVVGRIEMPEATGSDWREGTGLTLVDQIDFAKEKPDRPLFDDGSANEKPATSAVVTNAVGAFRETAKRTQSWFGSEYTIKQPGHPHVCEFTYPDDTKRVFAVAQREGVTRGAKQGGRTVCAVYVGGEYPTTGKMRTTSFLFWPTMPWGTLEVYDLVDEAPAAVGEMKLYEVTTPLPAARINNPAPDKYFGFRAERLDILHWTFGQAGVLLENRPFNRAMRSSWTCMANLVRHMRFAGQNTLYVPAFFYDRPYYPKAVYDDLTRARLFYPHFLDILAAVFEANDLNLILNVEWFRDGYLTALDEGTMRVTDEEVRAGKDTLRAVSRTGEQVRFTFIHTGFNYQHPLNEARFLKMVDEVAQCYRGYRSFKGMSFMAGDYLGPCVYRWSFRDEPLDYSYDDVSIRRFESEAGVRVPVDPADPERFAKRYDWLMSNAKEPWLNWRCQAVANLCLKARDIIRDARPDLSAYFMWGAYGNVMKNYIEGNSDIRNSLRLTGVDPEMFKDQPNLYQGLWCRNIPEFRNGDFFGAHRGVRNVEMGGLFGARAFFGLSGIYQENNGFVKSMSPGFWKSGYYVAQGDIAGDYQFEGYAHLFAHTTPACMMFGMGEMNVYLGDEMMKREFVRAYYTLPQGEYATLTGNGLDKNLAVRRCGKYFYLVNPFGSPLAVELHFSGSQPVARDLVDDELLLGATQRVVLPPFRMKTFKLETPGTEIAGAAAQPAPAVAAWSQARVEEMKVLAELARQNGEAVGAEAANAFVRMASDVEKAHADGDYNRVRLLSEDVMAYRIRAKLEEQAMAIPWRTIGPFDSPKSKGFDDVFTVEGDILAGKAPAASYPGKGGPAAWKEAVSRQHQGGQGFVSFDELFGEPTDWAVAYALTYVHSPRERDVALLLGSDDGIKVWVNGALVHSHLIGRGAAPAQDIVQARLDKGWNQVLIKVEDQIGGWGFYFAIAERGTRKYLLDLKYGRRP